MASPPALVAIAHRVAWAAVPLMSLTQPSRNPMIAPPGWWKLAPTTVERPELSTDSV
jgi:hypothetical protein